MSEVGSGSATEKQDPREAIRAASRRLIEEFPELFSKAFDVSLPPGWYEIARSCCQTIALLDGGVRVRQLKEKFGGARLYVDGGAGHIYAAIDAFEARSVTVCQDCGGNGRTRQKGWLIATLCDGCAQ